ncbi:NnrS family protein [Sphingomonas sp.]|uniref:NnrS family protein n=1 Tax=Sphingomonas sp. TaxID=28214 RepID=UPI0025E9A5F1|nr:NnrS family protein [Sphingomonas sp.]
MSASPPILRGGFRPFFLGGALWAVIALVLWLGVLAGQITIPTTFDALAWHRHEMLFGFVGAVIAGFLLTAIPNWTGRLPIAGAPLASLFGLWLAGRMAMLFSATLGPVVAAVVDTGFYFVLAGVAAREVIEANNRNVPIVGLLLLFGIANALDHLAAAGILADPTLPWRLAVALVTLMISLIGGRIVPSFTRNWLAKCGVTQGLPGQPNRFDLVAIGLSALGLIAWIAGPSGWLPGTLLAVAAAAQAIRLARWKGWKAVRDPLVLVLHVGYLWIPIGLTLLSASQFGQWVIQSAAVHALTAGAMGTMILAVMTRATLGHTGRELRAGPTTQVIYLLVTAGAAMRVAASLGALDYRMGMEVAGFCWLGSFVLFIFNYGPILFAPRLGEKS